MKVLCLHGYGQTGPAFAKKCTELSKELSKLGIETIFANGPVSIAAMEKDGSDYAVGNLKGRREMRAWWPVSDSDPMKYRMEPGIESLKGVVDAHGPFVGIMGFSQGGGMAGALAGNMDKFFPGHPPLKFAIFYSGFRLSLPDYQKYYNQILDIPTCHIVGQLDPVVSEERTNSLYNACEPTKRVKIMHPGTHFVPTSPQITEEVVHFVKHSLG